VAAIQEQAVRKLKNEVQAGLKNRDYRKGLTAAVRRINLLMEALKQGTGGADSPQG